VGWAASIDLNHRLAHALDLFWWEWWSGGVVGCTNLIKHHRVCFSLLEPLIGHWEKERIEIEIGIAIVPSRRRHPSNRKLMALWARLGGK